MTTPEHVTLLDDVREVVTRWRPVLPWLAGWHLTVDAVEDGAPISIESFYFIKSAVIHVTPFCLDWEPQRFFLDGEYTLDLLVVHELCHLLFEDLRIHIPEDELLGPVMINEEELAVWQVARALLRTRENASAATPRVRSGRRAGRE